METDYREALGYLDKLDDILDELDETGGIPSEVGDAYDVLWDYFMELTRLQIKDKKKRGESGEA